MALAEELTQETFFRAFKGFSKFRGESSVFTWLVSIAKMTYYGHLKKRRLRDGMIDLDSIFEDVCADDEKVEDIVARREVSKNVRRFLFELPEKYRDVVILRIYADMTFAQCAETLGITEKSARVIYFRAKKMLKERISNEY